MRTYIKDPSSSGNVLEISRTTGIYGERNEYDVTGQYRIDRPDLWIENEMITFPNGVKGFRATAAYSTGNANTGVTYLLANNSHGFGSFSRIINYGGTSGNIGGDNNYWLPVPYSGGANDYSYVSFYNDSRGINFHHSDQFGAMNTRFDIWFLVK